MVLKIPVFCAYTAKELKATGRVHWPIGEGAVLELWLEPDKEHGNMLLMSQLEINTAALTLTMKLDTAGLSSMDATVEEMTGQAFMIYQTYFYAMPKIVSEVGSVMCALQEHTMPEDPED